MATLTIRLPDDKAERLKNLAAMKEISVNKLFEEWATMALTEFDTRSSFAARAARGSASRGLELLQLMEQRESAESRSRGLHDNSQDDFKN
jgi:hypothetical protein